MSSTFDQAKLIITKNFRIFVREKQWRAELIGPLVCFALLLAAKQSPNNGALQLVSIEFLPMSILVTCRSITTMMIAEKSERQKEIQKIMGMKQSAYVLGWFISNLTRVLLVQTFFLVLTLSTGSLPAAPELGFDIWMIIASYIMYGLAQTAVAYFITALFDVPKTGGDVSMFMNLIGSVGSQLLQTSYFTENTWILYVLSIFPSFAYDIIPFRLVCQTCKNYNDHYTNGDYFMMLGIDIIAYALLYLYLDQVLPNEYGTNKHPLFLFGYSYNQQQKNQGELQNNVSMMQMNKPLTLNESYTQEDTSSALYHETFDNPRGFKKAVFIDNLRKYFGQTKAVDGVTLSIYDNQILCLLGHNGAGKTTTLSLLTGLIKKDSGTIYYSGKSTDEYLDEIRTYIGICPQKDVLYDSLTVDEHLEYFARIKGVPEHNIEAEINIVTGKCALQQERGKLASQLSGGNRRKLCLAMALIGNSRVIFLDEPTSGMDPVSRRKIWDILIQLKNEGKCLVLTTHHLDEAEVLSERIAIMARGKLLTVGSVDFVKRNFGIGYHLNLYNLNNSEQEWEQKSKNLRKLVLQYVPIAKENPQTANECVSFQVPFDQKEGFLNIFQYLENDNSVQISLMMNTLEEAFINIGMDEEQFLKKTRRFSTSQISYQEPKDEAIPVNELEDFSNIIAPECLKRSSEYYFSTQLYACFLRKLYGMQGKRLVVQLIVPTIFILFGPLFTMIYKKQFYNEGLSEDKAYEAWALFSVSSSTGDIIFGISIAAASIAGVPVLERQKKQKYALNVMGCRVMPYWLSNFLFDLCVFLILLVVYIAFVYAFDAEPLKSGQNFILTGLCLMAYIPLSYLLSWLFSDFQMALRLIVMIEIFVLYIIPWCIYYFVDNDISRWFMIIFFPSVTYFAGAIVGSVTKKLDKQEYFLGEWWPMVVIMIIQTLIYFALNILIDQKSLKAAVDQDAIVISNDSDVLKEAQRVEKPDCNDRVIAKKITKTYANGYQAVKGTSFGIRPGEIFGLLGPNGAGKSTTFNMITARLKPTQGMIFLEQQEVVKQSEIYQNVGICPQQDSLFELLTPVQHLRIWAYLKGLSGQEAEESIEYFLKVMQLKLYVDTPSDKLSGGNKRKLCVSLALIGGSNMQFFDEPSSGVDPIARRYLWNTIQQGIQLRQSAVILTTHTMDEAESLCSKIAIQVNGKFACIGTPQSLREKFGDGYRVTVTLYKDDDQENVDKMIKSQFLGCEVQEEEYLKITYKLPKQGFSFYKSFNFFLKTLQQQQLIKDFQLNQTTLEQIFMYFASLQDQVPELKETNKNRSIFASCMGNDEDD